MSHKYRAAIGRESRGRPAGELPLNSNRGVSAATSQKALFACFFTLEKAGGLPATSRQPEEILAGQTPACVSESVPLPKPDFSLPGIRQKAAAGLSADIPAGKVCARGQNQHPLTRVPAAIGLPLPGAPKGAFKPAHFPAANRDAPAAPRRRRIGEQKPLPPHAAGVRKPSFPR